MSDKNPRKLSSLKLSDKDMEAIAEMVATPGFRVWSKKIVPHREIQIALTNISMGTTEQDLWYNKGMANENPKSVKVLKDIADKFNSGNMDEDGDDDQV